MSAAIEVRGLRKDYRAGLGGREVKALSGIDLAVQPGELFGLLGPNGAGKTTAVKILLGLTHATAGSASLLGMPVADPESRRRVGYLPEGHRFPGLPHGAPDALHLRANVGRPAARARSRGSRTCSRA